MSIPALILAYVLVLLAGITGLAIYYELRRRQFEPTQSEDHVFRCTRCGFVYTDDPDVERSRCPHCGRMNGAIEF
jgi:rubrerythrin